MPIYELINPSDAYTFEAPDIVVAGIVACTISPAYGARQIAPEQDDPQRTPVFTGWAEWVKEHGITGKWLKAHTQSIIAALNSMLIGDLCERYEVSDTLALLPQENRAEWLADRNDRRRSSMNDIGALARNAARRLRESAD